MGRLCKKRGDQLHNAVKTTEQPEPVRYGLLLGCPVRKDGSLSTSQKRRCELAVEQYNQGNYDILLICGGPTRNGVVEAEVMKNHILEQQNLPILLEKESKNTWQNFENARRILSDVPVLVMTSSAHTPRAALIASRFFSRVRTASYPEWRARHVLREIPSLSMFFWLELKKKLQGGKNSPQDLSV